MFNNEQLADRIVNDLFQNGFGEQATRLELKQANGQHGERALGGLNREAVKHTVLKHLQGQRGNKDAE